MAAKDLIHRKPISTTAKGLDFLQDHKRIRRFVHEIGMKYLDYKESTSSEREDYGPIKFLDNFTLFGRNGSQGPDSSKTNFNYCKGFGFSARPQTNQEICARNWHEVLGLQGINVF